MTLPSVPVVHKSSPRKAAFTGILQSVTNIHADLNAAAAAAADAATAVGARTEPRDAASSWPSGVFGSGPGRYEAATVSGFHDRLVYIRNMPRASRLLVSHGELKSDPELADIIYAFHARRFRSAICSSSLVVSPVFCRLAFPLLRLTPVTLFISLRVWILLSCPILFAPSQSCGSYRSVSFRPARFPRPDQGEEADGGGLGHHHQQQLKPSESISCLHKFFTTPRGSAARKSTDGDDDFMGKILLTKTFG